MCTCTNSIQINLICVEILYFFNCLTYVGSNFLVQTIKTFVKFIVCQRNLKGQCFEIFCPSFFSWFQPIWARYLFAEVFSHMVSNLRRYLHVKKTPQCHWHRGVKHRGVIDTVEWSSAVSLTSRNEAPQCHWHRWIRLHGVNNIFLSKLFFFFRINLSDFFPSSIRLVPAAVTVDMSSCTHCTVQCVHSVHCTVCKAGKQRKKKYPSDKG